MGEEEDGERRLGDKKMKESRGESCGKLGRDRVLGLGIFCIFFLMLSKLPPLEKISVAWYL